MLQRFPTVCKVLSHLVLHTLSWNLSSRSRRLPFQTPSGSPDSVGSQTLRRLLGVDVQVLRVSQQANPLLLLPLLCHLKIIERWGFFLFFFAKSLLLVWSSSSARASLNYRRWWYSFPCHFAETNICSTQMQRAVQLKLILLKSCQLRHPPCRLVWRQQHNTSDRYWNRVD